MRYQRISLLHRIFHLPLVTSKPRSITLSPAVELRSLKSDLRSRLRVLYAQ